MLPSQIFVPNSHISTLSIVLKLLQSELQHFEIQLVLLRIVLDIGIELWPIAPSTAIASFGTI